MAGGPARSRALHPSHPQHFLTARRSGLVESMRICFDSMVGNGLSWETHDPGPESYRLRGSLPLLPFDSLRGFPSSRAGIGLQ